MIKEYLASKTTLFASIQFASILFSYITSNPIGFAVAIIGLLAGIFHLSITYHKWKNRKEGWAYNLMAKLFRWQ